MQNAAIFPVIIGKTIPLAVNIGAFLRQRKIKTAKLHILRLRRDKEGRQHHQAGAKQRFAPLETVIVFPSYFLLLS